MTLEDFLEDAPGDLDDMNIGVTEPDALGRSSVEVVKHHGDSAAFDKVHLKTVAGEPVVIGTVFVTEGDQTVGIPTDIIPFGNVSEITMHTDADYAEDKGVTTDGVGFDR